MPGHNENQFNYKFTAEYLSEINNGNTQNGDGTGNKLGVMVDAVNTNTIAGNSKLDTLETSNQLINTTTSSRLATVNTSIGSLTTANHTDLVALEASLTSMEGKIDTLDTVQDNALIKLGEIETSCDALISANHTDLVALESSLTAIEGKQDTIITHLSEIEEAAETIETAYGLNKCNINISSDAVGLATNTNLTNMSAKLPASLGQKANASSLSVCRTSTAGAYDLSGRTTIATPSTSTKLLCKATGELETNDALGLAQQTLIKTATQNSETALNNISVNMYNGVQQAKVLGSEDGSTSGTQRQLKVNSSGVLNVITTKSYTSEVSIISGQTVSGSGTHTTAAIANDANIDEYIVEHNFSGSDVSFEILESIDNSNFINAIGMSFNDPLDPSASINSINAIVIKSPHFKIKFTNANGSSRDVTLSYVAIKN